MAESTAAQGPQASGEDPGKTAVDRAAQGPREAGKLTGAEERSAIDYLLGTPAPAKYKVVVQYETPDGMKDLEFHFAALDGRKIDKIEQANINDTTGMMDKIKADAELVAEATSKIIDPETGTEVVPNDTRFRTMRPNEAPLASTVDALLARFGTQVGLLAGVASAIREAAGWNRDRVGKASRVLVQAAGN